MNAPFRHRPAPPAISPSTVAACLGIALFAGLAAVLVVGPLVDAVVTWNACSALAGRACAFVVDWRLF